MTPTGASRRACSKTGACAEVAASAREALVQLHHASRSGRPFSLVLTDANMPEVDGFSLAHAIKQDRPSTAPSS